MNRFWFIILGLFIIPLIFSCTSHKVELAPVEVKPIHITIDVYVKVDKELDDFFDDIDSAQEMNPEEEGTTDTQ